ncbi:hypothetical protein AGMMS49574_15290 [Bacteroidia bacterium]|nr:hypothetical protein AGMMS49574_15290 [Bacteroidia bacterium]
MEVEVKYKSKNSRYSKVQFIGMCICTTPSDLDSIEGTSDNGVYLGYEKMEDDMTRRANAVISAAQSIINSEAIDKSDSTLKVFVIPEFFFRGNKGAYYYANDFPESDFYNSYDFFIKYLYNMLNTLKTSAFQNWLFVLGTVLTTKDSVDKNAPAYATGDNLLDVYYRLHPKDANGNLSETVRGGIRSMLKVIDGKVPVSDNQDLAYQDILKDTLNYCDATASVVIENSCFVLPGGILDGGVYLPEKILKKYKSKEDFVLNSKYKEIDTGYLQTITGYTDIQGSDERKKKIMDEYAIFEYEGIVFGIDICLDHSRQRLFNFLSKYPDNYVDVQIVTSCGMSIRENAVIAKTGGTVFNCDGEYTLNDPKLATDGNHSHTSLRIVQTQINPAVPNPAAVLSDNLTPVDVPCTLSDGNLYPYTDYHLHIYPSQALGNV